MVRLWLCLPSPMFIPAQRSRRAFVACPGRRSSQRAGWGGHGHSNANADVLLRVAGAVGHHGARAAAGFHAVDDPPEVRGLDMLAAAGFSPARKLHAGARSTMEGAQWRSGRTVLAVGGDAGATATLAATPCQAARYAMTCCPSRSIARQPMSWRWNSP